MSAIDRFKLEHKYADDMLGDEIEIFGEEKKEPGTFDKLVSAASTLSQAAPEIRQGIERTIDPKKAQQQQAALPPAYSQQYQQPKSAGIPNWAIYAFGGLGLLGIGYLGFKARR